VKAHLEGTKLRMMAIFCKCKAIKIGILLSWQGDSFPTIFTEFTCQNLSDYWF